MRFKVTDNLGMMSLLVIMGVRDMMGCKIVVSLLWDILVWHLHCTIMRQSSDESEISRERWFWGGGGSLVSEWSLGGRGSFVSEWSFGTFGEFPSGEGGLFGFVETDVSPECAREKGCEVLTGK